MRLLSKIEVVDITGRSFPTLWAWMRSTPPKFPLARNVNGRPMWLASEVMEWINSLPTQAYKRGDGRQAAEGR